MTAESIIEEWKPKVNPWLMIIPLMGASFMFMLDETIANVALPHMAGSFSISREESMWIITSYLISSGIIITSVDFFSKLLGRKNFFMLSILIFVMASFLCGISNSIEMMIFSRILQGIGGGPLLPLSQAIILESFSEKDRGKSVALFGMVIIIAPIIGPVIGGWLTENYSWPFIYLINIPIGCISVLMSKMLLEDPPYAKKQSNVKIDSIGFFCLTGWLITLQIVLDKGNNADWFNALWICWTSAISVIFAISFIISQLKNKEPLCDLSVFKDKNFLFGTLMQIVMQGVLMASSVILPQFLQCMMGYDAFLSGLSMMPRGLGCLVAIIIYGTFSNKIDNRALVTFGLILLGISGWMLGFLNLQIALVNIAIPNFLYGLGMGLSMIPIITLSCITLQKHQMTNASGLQNLLKNIGGAIGTSLVATCLSRFSQVHQHYMVGNLNPLNPNYADRLNVITMALAKHTHIVVASHLSKYAIYEQLLQQSTLSAFIDVFRIFAIACVVIIPLMIFIKSKNKEEEQKITMH